MRINGINRPPVDAASTARPIPQRSAASAATKVAVSQQARQLAEARAPAVSDAAKVARLMAAVARGDFMVSAERVTDGMLAEER
jgi:flagellar biosynthesis anti-sigma factor FlgM